MEEKPRHRVSEPFSRRGFLKAAGTAGLAVATGGLLKACASATQTAPAAVTGERKDLILGLFNEPDHLNEFNKVALAGGILTKSNIHNRLVRTNYETGELEPELAVEWGPVDETTWRIKLREGVQWHGDYGEFTADDVVWTWNYARENEKEQAFTLAPVDTITAVDKYTVEVKLNEPYAPFPGLTMEYGGRMMPMNAYLEIGEEEFGRHPIGTGPFVFKEWQDGSHIVLTRNENYWRDALPHLEELTFRFIPDPGVRLSALRTGEIDWMDHPDAQDIPDVRAGEYPDLEFSSVAGWNWDYISFTFPPYASEDLPTGSIKEVRQAISHALDRQAIVDAIYFGEASVTDSPIPPGFLAHRPAPLRYSETADLDTARDLMASSGFSDGFEIECITSAKDWLRRELEIVADQLSEIGITVNIQNLDDATFRERWFEKQNEMILEDISIVAADPDATIWHFVHPDTSTYQGYPNTDVHDWVNEGRASSDETVRVEAYHKAVDQVLEDCPFIYICHVNIARVWRAGLTGLKVARLEDIMQLDWAKWEA